MDQWTVTWTYQCTPDNGRVAAETYVGWIEQKYENKKAHLLVKKLKIKKRNLAARLKDLAGRGFGSIFWADP
jgi:hypothetical protein